MLISISIKKVEYLAGLFGEAQGFVDLKEQSFRRTICLE